MRKVPLGEDVEPCENCARHPRVLRCRSRPTWSTRRRCLRLEPAVRMVGMQQFELAKDKIMMGAERRSMVMSETEKLQYRLLTRQGTRLWGASCRSMTRSTRSRSSREAGRLGVTMFLPEEDRYSHSRRHIVGQVTSLFGGRVAEEMTLGADGITTGAHQMIFSAPPRLPATW